MLLGFRLFVESTFFRIFWVCVLIAASICTFLLSRNIVVKLRDFPIVIYLSNKPITLKEVSNFKDVLNLVIPFQVYFPAVTMCTGLTADYAWQVERRLKIKRGTLKLEQLDEETLSLMHVHNLVARNDFLVKYNLSLSTDDFKKKLESFDDLFGSVWFSKYILFEMYTPEFLRLLTYWGICSTFNMASFDRIFDENG
jgi:hypothetical protein